MAKDFNVHITNGSTEDSDLNIVKSMLEDNDQHDPMIMIEESDQHPSRSKSSLQSPFSSRMQVKVTLTACLNNEDLYDLNNTL